MFQEKKIIGFVFQKKKKINLWKWRQKQLFWRENLIAYCFMDSLQKHFGFIRHWGWDASSPKKERKKKRCNLFILKVEVAQHGERGDEDESPLHQWREPYLLIARQRKRAHPILLPIFKKKSWFPKFYGLVNDWKLSFKGDSEKKRNRG